MAGIQSLEPPRRLLLSIHGAEPRISTQNSPVAVTADFAFDSAPAVDRCRFSLAAFEEYRTLREGGEWEFMLALRGRLERVGPCRRSRSAGTSTTRCGCSRDPPRLRVA